MTNNEPACITAAGSAPNLPASIHFF